MRDVVLPQALRISLPATIGFLVQLIKGTSLAAIVGFTELARAGSIVSNQIFQPLLVFGIVGGALLPAVLAAVALWLPSRAALRCGDALKGRNHPPEDRSMSVPSAAVAGAVPMIAMEGVEKWYGTYKALTDVNLTVRAGEKIVLCGPSGSGKSTLIRCINRLERYPGAVSRGWRCARRRPASDRRRAPRGRHGVPAVQPVPAPDRDAELHPRADAQRGRSRSARPRRPRAGCSTA